MSKEQEYGKEPVLDKEQLDNLREILGDDEEMSLSTLVSTFLETAEEQLDSIDLALDIGDRRTIIETAHSLKGSSGNFGATKLVRLSKDLQINGDTAQEEELRKLTTNLKEEFERVREALKDLD